MSIWPTSSPIELTLHGVLRAGKWTTEAENMHDNEWWRNGLITTLNGWSKPRWETYYQGFNNDQLIDQGAIIIVLSQDAGWRIDTLKTMSDDDQREAMILHNNIRTGIPIGDLRGLTNRQLVRLALRSSENLYRLADNEVKSTVRTTFLAQLKTAPSVHSVFFASENKPSVDPIDGSFVDNIACALVCSAISRSALYGFNNTINQSKADSYWQTQLDTASAKKEGRALYDWAFPDHCKSAGYTFREYLSNNPAGKWASELADHVTTTTFLNVEIGKLIAGATNWVEKLNLILYKLFRLEEGYQHLRIGGHLRRIADRDGKLFARLDDLVLYSWTKANPTKSIQNNWNDYNYLPRTYFQGDQFISEINRAINVSHTTTTHSVISSGGFPVINNFDTTYFGTQVELFLGGKPKQLGLTTGRPPENVINRQW